MEGVGRIPSKNGWMVVDMWVALGIRKQTLEHLVASPASKPNKTGHGKCQGTGQGTLAGALAPGVGQMQRKETGTEKEQERLSKRHEVYKHTP